MAVPLVCSNLIRIGALSWRIESVNGAAAWSKTWTIGQISGRRGSLSGKRSRSQVRPYTFQSGQAASDPSLLVIGARAVASPRTASPQTTFELTHRAQGWGFT